jgi:hypothetical protein
MGKPAGRIEAHGLCTDHCCQLRLDVLEVEGLADVTHGGAWYIGVLVTPGVPEMFAGCQCAALTLQAAERQM